MVRTLATRISRFASDSTATGWKTISPLTANRYQNYTGTERFTLGGTFGYNPFSWWQNRVTAGFDNTVVQAQLLSFRSAERARLTLHVPQMHCTSCIWLLEHLPRLHAGVVEARVQFLRKEITITYLTAEISLPEVVQLLASVGYEPQITLAELGAQPHRASHTLYYQLGLAAFAFGNVMLLALPDYFSFVEELQAGFGRFFGYLSLALALPVLSVCASSTRCSGRSSPPMLTSPSGSVTRKLSSPSRSSTVSS